MWPFTKTAQPTAKQKQAIRRYAAEKQEQPPEWRLETKVLPTHNGKFEVKAVLEVFPYRFGLGAVYIKPSIEELERFSGSQFLRRYNAVRGVSGGCVGSPPQYSNLLAAESVEAALIREFGKALDVIERRKNIRSTVTTAPTPTPTTKVEVEDHDEQVRWKYQMPSAMTFGQRTVVSKAFLLDLGMDSKDIARLLAEEWERGMERAIIKLRQDRHIVRSEDYGR